MSTFPLIVKYQLSLLGQKNAILNGLPSAAEQLILVMAPNEFIELSSISADGFASLSISNPVYVDKHGKVTEHEPISFNTHLTDITALDSLAQYAAEYAEAKHHSDIKRETAERDIETWLSSGASEHCLLIKNMGRGDWLSLAKLEYANHLLAQLPCNVGSYLSRKMFLNLEHEARRKPPLIELRLLQIFEHLIESNSSELYGLKEIDLRYAEGIGGVFIAGISTFSEERIYYAWFVTQMDDHVLQELINDLEQQTNLVTGLQD
jgi:hypothetical protein